MSKQPEGKTRWYAVVGWTIATALAFPIWVLGFIAGALKAPLTFASGKLNAELRRKPDERPAEEEGDGEEKAEGS